MGYRVQAFERFQDLEGFRLKKMNNGFRLLNVFRFH